MAKSPTWFLNEATGESLTDLAKRGFGAWLIALAASVIGGMQEFFTLLTTPIDLLTDLMRSSLNAFILEPLGIVIAGSEASAAGVREFGVFGLIIAVLIVLAAFYIVIRYLQEAETTDVPFPGLVVDVIPWVGAEEEQDPGD